jgi:D-alanyl-D-alanine carboxypeptidase
MTHATTRRRGLHRVGRAALALALAVGIGLIWNRTGAALTASPSPGTGSERAADIVLLVNADHPLPDDYPTPDLVRLVDLVPVANADVAVASEVERPLRDLFAAARRAGLTRLYVASGYRTAADQQQLWDDSPDRSYVQRPGRSEHQTGLAVDLADLKVGEGDFGASRAGRWLAKNAWRHGFILRYPAGKESVTGIPYEAWHFRYVGRAVARVCHAGGLVLEEYVASR